MAVDVGSDELDRALPAALPDHPCPGARDELSRVRRGMRAAVQALMRRRETIPAGLEADPTMRSGDVVCRVTAESNKRRQQRMIEPNHCEVVTGSAGIDSLQVVVLPRGWPLPETTVPAFGRDAR